MVTLTIYHPLRCLFIIKAKTAMVQIALDLFTSKCYCKIKQEIPYVDVPIVQMDHIALDLFTSKCDCKIKQEIPYVDVHIVNMVQIALYMLTSNRDCKIMH